MARSLKRTPIFARARNVNSEKLDKRVNHKRERAHLRIRIHNTAIGETPVLDRREVSNVAKMSKIGKEYWTKATEKDMRK